MIYRFGDCTLDPERRELLTGGEARHLEPQVFDLLVFLVASGGRVITKDELVDAIWGGRAISDDALTSRIKSARQAIGDDGRTQWAIRTLHRIGYQFVAEVTGALVGQGPQDPAPVPTIAATGLPDRDDAFAALELSLGSVAAGSGRVAVVTGEAGIGKTSLVRAFAERVEGLRLLRGACEDLAIAEPLGPLHDIAGALGRSQAVESVGTAHRLDAYSHLLRWIGDTPTLLVIEDLHWADDATIEFLRYVARRIEAVPLLLVLTARSDDAAGRRRVRAALDGVAPEVVTRIALGPLSETTVRRLAAAAGRDPEDVLAQTGGNALFVSELLRGEAAIPASVQDAVLGRADRLAPEPRALVDIASVFVGPPDERVLADMLDGDLETALEAAVGAGLLVDTERGIAFRHELTRRAIEAALRSSVRRGLNARVLAALQDRPDVPRARLLHHAHAAGDEDTVAALAPDAAAEAERLGARREAAAYYELALAHGDRLAREPQFLARAARAFYMIGRYGRAAALQRQAIDRIAASGEDRLREGDATRWLARYLAGQGQFEASWAAAHRALRLLADLPGPELAMAYSTLAQFSMLDLDFDAAAAYAEPAIRLARDCGRNDILSHALNNLGISRMYSDPAEANRLLDESIAVAEALDEPDHVARGRFNQAAMCEYHLDFPRMERLSAAAHAYCRSQELVGYAAYSLGLRAIALLRLGRWDEAAGVVAPTLAADVEDRMEMSSFPAFCVAVWIAMRRGEAFEEPLAAVTEFVARMDELQRTVDLAAIEAERAWLGLGPAEPAIARLTRVLERVSDPTRTQVVALWLHRLAPERLAVNTDRFHAPIARELAGDARGAAVEWRALSMPYEQALALTHPDPGQAVDLLTALGAKTAIAAVQRRHGIGR